MHDILSIPRYQSADRRWTIACLWQSHRMPVLFLGSGAAVSTRWLSNTPVASPTMAKPITIGQVDYSIRYVAGAPVMDPSNVMETLSIHSRRHPLMPFSMGATILLTRQRCPSGKAIRLLNSSRNTEHGKTGVALFAFSWDTHMSPFTL